MGTRPSKRSKGIYALPKLAKIANRYHREANHAWYNALDYARASGRALVKARSFFPVRGGGWKKWIEDNFDASYETAKVYMRIARKWDDPRLEEARTSGINVNSIVKVLQILKYQKLRDSIEEKFTEKEAKVDMARDYIRKMFAEKLRKEVSRSELMVLVEDDVFDYLWKKLYAGLRNIICQILEYDPYEDKEKVERVKQIVRQKVKEALNKGRRSQTMKSKTKKRQLRPEGKTKKRVLRPNVRTKKSKLRPSE